MRRTITAKYWSIIHDKSDEYILHIIPRGLFNNALDKQTKGLFHGCSLLHSTANNNMQLIKKHQYQDTTNNEPWLTV